jgi:uncharacterized delta-60 repeat protein
VSTIDMPGLATALALQGDGKVVVAGVAATPVIDGFGLARFNADGGPDKGFGTVGKVITDIGFGEQATALALQPGGKIVAAGFAATGANHDFTVLRYEANGNLDSSFDSDGIMTTDFGAEDQARSLALQSDGKIVVAGSVSIFSASNPVRDISLARYNPNGSLDSSFGSGGKVITDFGGGSEARAVALQHDGKILVAGSASSSSAAEDDLFSIFRYNADGRLDTSFGTLRNVGTVVTNLGGEDVALALAFQPDGKIVLAGATAISFGNFSLARYSADGQLDPGFGAAGRVITSMSSNSSARGVAVQPDGKIVVTGLSSGDFTLVRYNPDGSLDSGFGSAGKVITDFGGPDFSFAIALQPDGKIVVAGSSFFDFALARYDSGGSLDMSFGSGGKATASITGSEQAFAMALQPDGKIVLAGVTSVSPINPDLSDFALARFNSNGSLDTGFGSGGKVVTDFGGGDIVTSLALQPDGKIVVAGSARAANFIDNNFAVARYNANGSLDLSFGAEGITLTDFGQNDSASAVALQADGKIVVAGSVIQGTSDFALARFNSNGSLDTGFGSGGKVTTNIRGFDRAFAMAVRPDGKITVAGEADMNFALARYESVESFDICLQDESSGDTLKIDSITGNYQFTRCGSSLVLDGTGTLIKRGSTLILQHFQGDRNVSAKIDTGINKATATIRIYSQGTLTISDRNIANNTCACP